VFLQLRVLICACPKGHIILNALLKGGVLTMENMSKKFLCLKIEEMNVFKSVKINIAKQIKNS
jgi:hypothetical protein